MVSKLKKHKTNCPKLNIHTDTFLNIFLFSLVQFSLPYYSLDWTKNSHNKNLLTEKPACNQKTTTKQQKQQQHHQPVKHH